MPRANRDLDLLEQIKEKAHQKNKSIIINIYRRSDEGTRWVAQAVYPPDENIPPTRDPYIMSALCTHGEDCDDLHESLIKLSFSVRVRSV